MRRTDNRSILMERFYSKVRKTPTCWIWIGSLTGTRSSRRGQIKINGKSKLATHVAWELHVGPVPEGKRMLHKRKCNNSLCVRFDHLYPGTDKENTADAIALGRKHWMDGLPLDRKTCRLGHPLIDRDSLGRQWCRICRNMQAKQRRGPPKNPWIGRKRKRFTLDGVSLTQREWAVRTGLSEVTISKRLKRGWSLMRALTLATRKTKRSSK